MKTDTKKSCDLCDNKIDRRTAYSVEMDTLEGKHKIKICDDCAIVLEALRLLKDGKELKDESQEESF